MKKSHPQVAFIFTGRVSLKLKTLVSELEKLFPAAWADEWDRPGLLCGDPESEIAKVYVCLDSTSESVLKAVEMEANLLVSHHPAFIRPLERVTPESLEGATVFEALRHGVSLYAIHTNWDVSHEGVNVILAREAGLVDADPLAAGKNGSWGIGAVGDLPEEIPLSRVSTFIREAWKLSWIRVIGEKSKPVKRVALCGGAGGDLLEEAIWSGADLFITADIGYHKILQGLSAGLAIAVCDHGEMENVSLCRLSELIHSVSGLQVETAECPQVPFYFEYKN